MPFDRVWWKQCPMFDVAKCNEWISAHAKRWILPSGQARATRAKGGLFTTDAQEAFIYRIVHVATGDVVYIGKTENMSRRGYAHKRLLKRGRHQNKHLQEWFNSACSSVDEIAIDVIDHITGRDVGIREVYWIALGRALGLPLTNVYDGGDGIHKKTQATKEKIRQKALMRWKMWKAEKAA